MLVSNLLDLRHDGSRRTAPGRPTDPVSAGGTSWDSADNRKAMIERIRAGNKTESNSAAEATKPRAPRADPSSKARAREPRSRAPAMVAHRVLEAAATPTTRR